MSTIEASDVTRDVDICTKTFSIPHMPYLKSFMKNFINEEISFVILQLLAKGKNLVKKLWATDLKW